jgi:hypothetical protein
LLLIAKVFSEPELDLARIPLIEETILHFMPIWLGKTNCPFFEHEHIDEANLKRINVIYFYCLQMNQQRWGTMWTRIKVIYNWNIKEWEILLY